MVQPLCCYVGTNLLKINNENAKIKTYSIVNIIKSNIKFD